MKKIFLLLLIFFSHAALGRDRSELPSLVSMGYVIDNAYHSPLPPTFKEDMAKGVKLNRRSVQCSLSILPIIYMFSDGFIFASQFGNDYYAFDYHIAETQGCRLPRQVPDKPQDPGDDNPQVGSYPTLQSLGYRVDNANHQRPMTFEFDMARGKQITQREHQCSWAVRPLIYVFPDGVVYATHDGADYNIFTYEVVRRQGCYIPPLSQDNDEEPDDDMGTSIPNLSDMGYTVDNANHRRPPTFDRDMNRGKQITQAEHQCSWATRPLIYVFPDGIVYANFGGGDYNIFTYETVLRHGCYIPPLSTPENPCPGDCCGESCVEDPQHPVSCPDLRTKDQCLNPSDGAECQWVVGTASELCTALPGMSVTPNDNPVDVNFRNVYSTDPDYLARRIESFLQDKLEPTNSVSVCKVSRVTASPIGGNGIFSAQVDLLGLGVIQIQLNQEEAPEVSTRKILEKIKDTYRDQCAVSEEKITPEQLAYGFQSDALEGYYRGLDFPDVIRSSIEVTDNSISFVVPPSLSSQYELVYQMQKGFNEGLKLEPQFGDSNLNSNPLTFGDKGTMAITSGSGVNVSSNGGFKAKGRAYVDVDAFGKTLKAFNFNSQVTRLEGLEMGLDLDVTIAGQKVASQSKKLKFNQRGDGFVFIKDREFLGISQVVPVGPVPVMIEFLMVGNAGIKPWQVKSQHLTQQYYEHDVTVTPYADLNAVFRGGPSVIFAKGGVAGSIRVFDASIDLTLKGNEKDGKTCGSAVLLKPVILSGDVYAYVLLKDPFSASFSAAKDQVKKTCETIASLSPQSIISTGQDIVDGLSSTVNSVREQAGNTYNNARSGFKKIGKKLFGFRAFANVSCDELIAKVNQNTQIHYHKHLFNWVGVSGERKVWFDSCEKF